MSSHSPELPPPLTTAEPEANNDRTRLSQAQEKSYNLRARIEEEDAKLTALVKDYKTRDISIDGALAEHITGTDKLITSVKRNYNLACGRFAAHHNLTDQGQGEENVFHIERRLLALEVGLQGIQHDIRGKDTTVGEGNGEHVAEARLPEENDSVEGTKGDGQRGSRLAQQDSVGEGRKNLPAVGLYRV